MVNTESTLEVASQGTYGQRGEDRKINLIVDELKKYNVRVATLQKTKWFDSEMYQVNRSVLLTSGCTLPDQGESVLPCTYQNFEERGEGGCLSGVREHLVISTKQRALHHSLRF